MTTVRSKAAGSHTHDMDLSALETTISTTRDTAITAAIAAEARARDTAIGEAIKAAEARIIAALRPVPLVSARVTSVEALLDKLHDDRLDEIVVADGTYRVAAAALQKPTSLWIGSAYAARTRPILVRSETLVTFDGGAAIDFGGITFVDGAHDQAWQGFRFTNGEPTSTGAIVFGGYPNLAPPHHITLRGITVLGLVTRDGLRHGYPIYFSMAAAPGPHDLLIEDFMAIDSGASKALLHFFHDTQAGDPPGNFNCQNVIIKGADLSGSPQPIMVYPKSLTNLLFEDVVIRGAGETAIRYEGGSGVVFRNVKSTGSAQGGFYSSLGPNPPGVTFDACDLR